MITEILMPKLGLTMTEGMLVKWLKNEGDSVEEKEPVLEIETEKLSYVVESSVSGIILKIIASEGEKYPVADVLGYIGNPGDTIPDQALSEHTGTSTGPIPTLDTPDHTPLAGDPGKRIFISPHAKKIATDMGIDYKQIKGTGPNGRIVKADILKFKEPGASSIVPNISSTPKALRTNAKLIPYTGIRRAVGETMSASWANIPMVTHHVSADMETVLNTRTKFNEGISDKTERITIGEFIIKLTAAALRAMPIMNSSLTDEGIIIHDNVNIAMATALDDGLIVPVIHDADLKSLRKISQEAKNLAIGARSGTLNPDQLHGGTFTISNLGGYGSVDYFTPIINPPQAAILGVGRINDTAVPINGEIKIRPMVGLSLTYDHRIIDGATAAEFAKILINYISDPICALL